MDSIGNSGVVFSVTFGQNEQWNVTTQKNLRPLASFNDPQTACEWAVEHAKPMRGQVVIGDIPVVVEKRGHRGTPLSALTIERFNTR